MSKFFLSIAKIVGSPKGNTGCWIHTFLPPQEEKVNRRGQIFAVATLSGLTAEEEIAAAGKELISRLHEEYYGDLSDTAFIQLKKAVEKVSLEFKAEIAAVAEVKGVFNAALIGDGRLIFCRGGKTLNLLAGSSEGEVKTGSGYLRNHDLFLLGSGEFFKLVAQGVLQAALMTGSPSEAAEALAPIIHGQENGSGAAAIIVKVEEKPTKPVTEERVTQKRWIEIKNKFQRRFSDRLSLIIEKAREKEKAKRSPKTLITVALVLLFILGVSVVLGSRQRQQLGITKETQSLFAEAKAKKDEGQGLLTLNPEKARQLLLEAQTLSQKIESQGLKSQEFDKLKQELAEALKMAIREYRVEGKTFLDLGLIRSGSTGDDWVALGGQLIILDENQSAVYRLGTKDKKSTILADGEDLKGARQVTASSPAAYVLTEKGIVEYQFKIKNLKLKISRDKDWGEITDMEIFGGNLYLLDKQGEIWKYAAVTDGFGPKQRWLKEKVDFGQAVSLAIDGAVWVLTADGRISKFAQGEKANFRPTGLTKSLSQPRAVFTDSESEYLYVLDTGNSRIVALKKTGEYDREYLWQGIKDVSNLAVFEKDSLIFLLSGSKVFQINIK